MRVRVNDDVIEVKRTHIYNRADEIGVDFIEFIKSKFSINEDISDFCVLALKSSSESDGYAEVVVVCKYKSEVLELINKLTKNGYIDLRKNWVVCITDEEWNKLFL